MTALTFAALAFASAALDTQTDQYSSLLESLTWAFIIGALIFLTLAAVFGLGLIGVMLWNYFHAVEVPSGKWYCRYWPAQRKAHVSGIWVKTRSSAGRVRVDSLVRFAEDAAAQFSDWTEGDGTYGPGFHQIDVDFASDPQEGDLATVTVTATPDWWRGRPATRTEQVAVGITDHRRTVTSAQVHDALNQLDALINEAQSILEACGRPNEQMTGAAPMYFQKLCIPRINKFYADATKTINDLVPEYIGKFQNVGNVTHNANVKPVMIQQVEKSLENLGIIEDELRKRLE